MVEKSKVELLRSIKAKAKKIDGTEQKKQGKLTARERIDVLFDEGTFVEVGALVRKAALTPEEVTTQSTEGVITGYGAVDGRLVFVYAQDATVLNGAMSVMQAKKIVRIMELAKKAGAVLIGIVDCGGGYLEEGIDLLTAYSEIMTKAMEIKSSVPQITVVAGYCTGISAMIAQISDVVVMADKGAKMYLQAGQCFGIVDEKFGDAASALENGTAHLIADTDEAAIEKAKEVLAFLPDNLLTEAFVEVCEDDVNRGCGVAAQISENIEYDAKDVVSDIADAGSVLELKSEHAKEAFTAFARMDGKAVGFVANNPKENGGALTVKAMSKIEEFVNLCDGLNIPVVTLVNTKGYDFKPCQAKAIMDCAVSLNAVYKSAEVPKITILAGKAYGSAYLTMGSGTLSSDVAFALPGAEISVISPEGGADIFFADTIKGAKDPFVGRKMAEEKFKDIYNNPYVAAAKGLVDDVIDPAELRPILATTLDMLASKMDME